MTEKLCPSCQHRIFDEYSIFHQQNRKLTCYICQKTGCEECFFRHRSGVMKIRMDGKAVVACSRECAGKASERSTMMWKRPKKISLRKLKPIGSSETRTWKTVKNLAKFYFSLDDPKRRTLWKFSMMNKDRIETWEIPDPEYHRDAPLLLFHEEINDLIEEWGHPRISREEIIILLSFHIYEKMIYAYCKDMNISRESRMEDAVENIVETFLKDSLDRYGSDREYTGDPLSSISLYQKTFTLWIFLYTNFDVDLGLDSLVNYFDNYYHMMVT